MVNEFATHTRPLRHYHAWDRTVRIFHWVNVFCVLMLIALGMILLFDDELGIGTEGKQLVKTFHVYIGYVFVLNLGWRILWGFIGSRYARWHAILPLGRTYRAAQASYANGEKSGKPVHFAGHNPIARWMVSLLFLLLTTQAVSGLVLAGTDLQMPPFGNLITRLATNSSATDTAGGDAQAATTTAINSEVATANPVATTNAATQIKQRVRGFRKPFIKTHVWVFYILAGAIALHIFAVIVQEVREKSGLISAMITGHKVFSEQPADDL